MSGSDLQSSVNAHLREGGLQLSGADGVQRGRVPWEKGSAGSGTRKRDPNCGENRAGTSFDALVFKDGH